MKSSRAAAPPTFPLLVRPPVFTFLRIRTWMRIDDTLAAATMIADAKAMGEMEGLAGHAAAAAMRLPRSVSGVEALTGSEALKKNLSTKEWDTTGNRLHFALPKKARAKQTLGARGGDGTSGQADEPAPPCAVAQGDTHTSCPKP